MQVKMYKRLSTFCANSLTPSSVDTTEATMGPGIDRIHISLVGRYGDTKDVKM